MSARRRRLMPTAPGRLCYDPSNMNDARRGDTRARDRRSSPSSASSPCSACRSRSRSASSCCSAGGGSRRSSPSSPPYRSSSSCATWRSTPAQVGAVPWSPNSTCASSSSTSTSRRRSRSSRSKYRDELPHARRPRRPQHSARPTATRIGALYALAYTLKFAAKKSGARLPA